MGSNNMLTIPPSGSHDTARTVTLVQTTTLTMQTGNSSSEGDPWASTLLESLGALA